MSESELKRARHVMLPCRAPRHVGVSLRTETALLGDPMWRSMVAPALARSHAAWATTTRPARGFFLGAGAAQHVGDHPAHRLQLG
eukprot:4867230-Pyramimonas_sp.AAC.1